MLLVTVWVFIYFRSTYQIDDSSRSGLVLGTLCEEEQTLSSLGRPGTGWVRDAVLLVGEVGGQVLHLDSLIAEPEVALGESETPVEIRCVRMLICVIS